MELDKDQFAAVRATESRIIVAAASGSGKTRTIISRINYLLSVGIEAESIYAITFTNLAAEEMLKRLDNKEVHVSTIHSLANQILIRNGLDTSKFIQNEDFDELLSRCKDTEIPHISHLLVDEFQDICSNEYEFVSKTLHPDNYFYCGDSRQAIYGFKGANYKYFLQEVYDPAVKCYELTYNYRSGPDIIDFASNFLFDLDDIYNTPVRPVVKKKGCVKKITLNYDSILQEIQSNPSYKDWFILCRTNEQVNFVKSYLIVHGVPCDSFHRADIDNATLMNKMSEDTVKILTIHTSKGLENKNVIVIGALKYNSDELKICYVAATRAEEYLVWMIPEKKKKKKQKSINFDLFF